jgi:hypothetical protein
LRVESEKKPAPLAVDQQGRVARVELHEKIENTEMPRARTIEITTSQMMA